MIAGGPETKFLVVDAIPIATIDITGLYALQDLMAELKRQGVAILFAGRKTELFKWLQETGIYRPEHERMLFSTIDDAIAACEVVPLPT